MSAGVLTVSQVNFFVKSLIEGDGRLSDILISGEISNFTDHYRSGHLYFSLKDEKSVLKAVMFASAARRLRFRPADGMKVIIRGRGVGLRAHGAVPALRRGHAARRHGRFEPGLRAVKGAPSRGGTLRPGAGSGPLPPYPERIGVITSPTGAAVRDILQITGRRWPVARIVLCPVLVQGEGGAPAAHRRGEGLKPCPGLRCDYPGPGGRLHGGPVGLQRRGPGPGGGGLRHPRGVRCGARDGLYHL